MTPFRQPVTRLLSVLLALTLLLSAWTPPAVRASEAEEFIEANQEYRLCSAEIPRITFRLGERLTYSVRYLGVKAGVVEMEVKGKVQRNGRECYHLQGTAWSTGIGRMVYPAYFVQDTYIDVQTQRPVSAEQHWHMQKYYERIVWNFQPDICKVDRKKFKLFHKRDKINVYEDLLDYDPDSPEEYLFFYRMRFSNCPPGTLSFHYLFADQESYELGVRHVANRTLRTKKGRTEVRVVEPVYLGGIVSDFTKQTRLQISFDTSPERLPWRVRLTTTYGAGYLVLESYR